jgi:hypothetical protein
MPLRVRSEIQEVLRQAHVTLIAWTGVSSRDGGESCCARRARNAATCFLGCFCSQSVRARKLASYKLTCCVKFTARCRRGIAIRALLKGFSVLRGIRRAFRNPRPSRIPVSTLRPSCRSDPVCHRKNCPPKYSRDRPSRSNIGAAQIRALYESERYPYESQQAFIVSFASIVIVFRDAQNSIHRRMTLCRGALAAVAGGAEAEARPRVMTLKTCCCAVGIISGRSCRAAAASPALSSFSSPR